MAISLSSGAVLMWSKEDLSFIIGLYFRPKLGGRGEEPNLRQSRIDVFITYMIVLRIFMKEEIVLNMELVTKERKNNSTGEL